MPESKPRIVISIRVSSKEQMEEGYGYAAQVRRLPEIVEEMGWVLARKPDGSSAIYDEGYASTTPADPSATSMEHRPVMQALLADLSFTRPTYLLCRQLDRLYRDSFEHALVMKQLIANGARGIVEAPMLSAVRITDIDDPQQRLVSDITSSVASYQKADQKIKLMVGRHQRAREGKPNGGRTPYGYHRPHRKEGLKVQPAEAEIYCMMVALVMENEPAWGPAKIAHELVKRGVPNRSGKPEWTATTVRRILLSKAQCGYMRRRFDGQNHADEWVPAAGQEPIISEQDWKKLQAVLGARRRESGHSQRKHVLAGLLRCAACGKTLKAHPDRRKDANGRRYINYSCRVYNSGCTAGYSISETRALRELSAWVNARLAATDAEGWHDDFTTGPADVGLLEERIAALSTQLDKATRLEERAYALYVEADELDETRARAEYERRRDAVRTLRTELERSEADYGSAQTSGGAEQLSLHELREVLRDWENFPPNEKRTALGVVIDRAILGPRDANPRLTIVPAGAAAEAPAGTAGFSTDPLDENVAAEAMDSSHT